MKRRSFWGLLLALLVLPQGCQSSPMTQEQRALRAQQVRELLAAGQELAGEKAKPYFAALEPILGAYVEGQALDWSTAFDTLHAAEPLLRQALLDADVEPAKVDAILHFANLLLLEIQLQVSPSTPAPASS